MTDRSRHNSDLTVYLCGDHSDPEQFFYAERNIQAAMDYCVINPTKLTHEYHDGTGVRPYTLLERLEMIQHSDVLVYLNRPREAYEFAEIEFAHAVDIDVVQYENFLEPYEVVRDCD